MIPKDLRYTDEHEWVRMEGDVATVGVTDHAQQQMGDLTFVELPEAGTRFQANETACALESSKAAADVFAPATGMIVSRNEDLEDDPGRVNSDPYGTGWIYKMKIDDVSEIDRLMDAEAYKKFVQEEAH